MRRWICSQGRHAFSTGTSSVIAARRLRKVYGTLLILRAMAAGCRRARRQVRAVGRWLKGSGQAVYLAARSRGEAGMSTAEYAVGTIAACAFAGLLYKIVTSPDIRKMLADILGRALRLAG
ncbi:hypothetical protein GCM10009677_25840 [Sphaerisporangium rubeum]|uniref:DUF4244 domain-containing protein n=1 Tax=Sphaerisporangium rubeum TaxID=321317 RepID=A0A7X0ICS3_9ACTN|nr:hypothetical protein [Sphaerisporangium rubeum]